MTIPKETSSLMFPIIFTIPMEKRHPFTILNLNCIILAEKTTSIGCMRRDILSISKTFHPSVSTGAKKS